MNRAVLVSALVATVFISSCVDVAGTPSPSSSSGTAATAIPSSPLTSMGADTLLLRDDLETQTDWDLVDAPTGRVEYGDGTLRMSFDVVGSIWSDRELQDRWRVLRIEGKIYLRDDRGAAGYMCGSGPLDHIGGVVNSAGNWFVVETVNGDTNQLASGTLENRSALDEYELAVECAGTATGALRLRMLANGVAVPPFERPTGPPDFDRGVAFASIGSVDFNAEFDDVVIYGGSEFLGAR